MKMTRPMRRVRRGASSRDHAGPGISGADVAQVLLVVVLLTGLVWGVEQLRRPGTLPVREVRVGGDLLHVDQQDLKQAVLGRFRGGLFQVNLSDIETSIEALPWVSEASVRRHWPDTLAVVVREHRAVARWGNNGLVTSRGEVFFPDRESMPDGLPVVFGPPGASRQLVEQLSLIGRILAPARLHPAALLVDERRAWHLMLGNGIEVAIGREDPVAMVKRLARIWPKDLASRAREMERIDLRYTNGLAVLWRQPVVQDKDDMKGNG